MLTGEKIVELLSDLLPDGEFNSEMFNSEMLTDEAIAEMAKLYSPYDSDLLVEAIKDIEAGMVARQNVILTVCGGVFVSYLSLQRNLKKYRDMIICPDRHGSEDVDISFESMLSVDEMFRDALNLGLEYYNKDFAETVEEKVAKSKKSSRRRVA